MKQTFILIALAITSIVYPEIQAETNLTAAIETKINKEVMKSGEQIFIEHADECLAII